MTEKYSVTSDLLLEWQNTGQIKLSKIGVKIQKATLSQIPQVASLIFGEAALIGASTIDDAMTTATEFITGGRGLVAIDDDNKIVSFQGLGLWPTIKGCELRSAETATAYRGQGLNTLMKKVMIHEVKVMFPGWQLVGFTEATSASRGILEKLGFSEISMDQVAADFSILGSVCPANSPCILRNSQECGCKVYLLSEKK